MVLEADGGGAAVVSRVVAQIRGIALVGLPVGWDHSDGGGGWPISGWRRRRVSSFKARRLHPFTGDGWAGGASNGRAVGI